MAIAKPQVEWFYDPNHLWKSYGLLCLAGKWAVVRGGDYTNDLQMVSGWIDDRETAIGFLKLLREDR
jgi:hypothetical protein